MVQFTFASNVLATPFRSRNGFLYILALGKWLAPGNKICGMHFCFIHTHLKSARLFFSGGNCESFYSEKYINIVFWILCVKVQIIQSFWFQLRMFNFIFQWKRFKQCSHHFKKQIFFTLLIFTISVKVISFKLVIVTL